MPEISELELVVATDAIEMVLESTVPDTDAAEKNREMMKRVYKRFVQLKEELGLK